MLYDKEFNNRKYTQKMFKTIKMKNDTVNI